MLGLSLSFHNVYDFQEPKSANNLTWGQFICLLPERLEFRPFPAEAATFTEFLA
jgi:hypothetical protein